jgi:hypothetical protein
MKVADLAKKPTLTKLTLDDEDTIKEYGESLDFYTLKPFPLDIFMKFQLRGAGDNAPDLKKTVEVLKDVVLDEKGKPIMVDGFVLPIPVLIRCISKLTTELGK